MTREHVGTVYGAALGVILFGLVGIAAAEPEPASSATANSAPVPIATTTPVVAPPDRQRRSRLRELELKLEKANGELAAYRKEAKGTDESIADYTTLTVWGAAILALLIGGAGLVVPVVNIVSVRDVKAKADKAIAAATTATAAAEKATLEARGVLESLESRFRSLNDDLDRERIEAAVVKCASSEPVEVNEGMGILRVLLQGNPNITLSDDQMRRMSEVATDASKAAKFLPFLSPSVYAQRLVQKYLGSTSTLDISDVLLFSYAALLAGPQDAIDFREWLLGWLAAHPVHLGKALQPAVESPQSGFLAVLVNDEAFLKKLPVLTKQRCFEWLQVQRLTRRNPAASTIIESSLLAKQFAGTVFVFEDKDGKETSDAQTAYGIVQFIDGELKKSRKDGQPGFEEFRGAAIEATRPANRRAEAPPPR